MKINNIINVHYMAVYKHNVFRICNGINSGVASPKGVGGFEKLVCLSH